MSDQNIRDPSSLHVLAVFGGDSAKNFSIFSDPNNELNSHNEINVEQENGDLNMGEIVYRGSYQKCLRKIQHLAREDDIESISSCSDTDNEATQGNQQNFNL